MKIYKLARDLTLCLGVVIPSVISTNDVNYLGPELGKMYDEIDERSSISYIQKTAKDASNKLLFVGLEGLISAGFLAAALKKIGRD